MTTDALTFALGGAYDRIADVPAVALENGLNLDLHVLSSPKDAFTALREDPSLAGGETSISFYLTEFSRSGRDGDLVALPVWMSRSFRHANVFVREHSDLANPADLKGKRIGLPEYGMTMAVWLRGMFADEHGVQPSDIEWVSHRPPAGLEADAVRYPENVSISQAPEGATLPDQLRTGSIDAWIGAGVAPPPPGIRRLFADPFAEERAYFARTGIFPIMHVLVVKRAILEDRPELGEAVFSVFNEAKLRAQARLMSTSVAYVTLPWTLGAVEEQQRAAGTTDPWPYGMDQNMNTLQALAGYMSDQGLLWQDVDVRDAFLPHEPAK